ncbi:Toll/interleukin-1 receptor-like proteiny [Sesbania bispinosa]|nr:Toll/interleukin-1 receptor-like proteiny [Sesbania bispinosa]
MGNDDADFMYDVFLISFSKGNSYAFTGHLYHALQNNGINTVRCSDNETDTNIVETIKKSRISMVVLCQNYARSTRCLDILIKIIECYDAKGKQVSVIFHNIVEWNSYAAAMIEYEENLGEHSDQVKAWRSALSRIGHGDLAGEYCTDK